MEEVSRLQGRLEEQALALDAATAAAQDAKHKEVPTHNTTQHTKAIGMC